MSGESEPQPQGGGKEEKERKSPKPESRQKKREKGEKPDQPLEVKIVGQEKPVEISIEEKQFEKIIAGMGEIKEALGEQTKTLIREFGGRLDKLAEEVSKLNVLAQGSLRTLEELRRKGEEIPPELLERIYGAISGLERSMAYYGDQQARYNDLLESQTPESLRIPTPEELLKQGGFSEDELELLRNITTRDGREKLLTEIKRIHPDTGEEITTYKVSDEIYSNEIYQQKVEEWFERKLRYLESFETAFEEQPELYNRLILAETFFRFKKETQPLAERVHKKIEARRITKRMARIWNLVTPDQLSGEAGRFNLDVIAEVFCHEDKDGKRPIAEEFQNYERLALKLSQERPNLKARIELLKRSLEDPRVKNTPQAKVRIELEIKELEGKLAGGEIRDYFEHGGLALRNPEDENSVITDENGRKLFVDEVIEIYQKKEASGEINPEEKDLLERLRNEFWARRTAGGLWSVTFRAAKFDVIINGTSDFFAGRIMNFADKLESRGGYAMKTKGIWMPEKGKYAGKPLDLGLRDFFTTILSKVPESILEEQEGQSGEEDKEVIKIREEFRGIKINREDDRVVESLADADLGNRSFWDRLIKFGSSKDEYNSTQIDAFQKADETRKFFWGPDNFFDDPDIQKFTEIKRAFQHIKEGKKIWGKWLEMTERYLEWMENDPKAPEAQEELLIAPASVKARLIEQLSEREVINNTERDRLLKEYVNFPIPGSPRTKASLRVLFDTLYGVMWRYPPTRNQLALGWLWELIRKSLQYVFAEELR